jgi:hypothetical protein
MTLPDERYRAVVETKKFLESIITTRSGLSKEIKETARWCLRHYPSEWDLEQAAEVAPHVFAKRMEDVTRLFKKYEQSKAENDKT